MEFLKDKKIDPSPFITHKFSIEKYQEAFNVLANKKHSHAIKVLFNFTNKKKTK